MKIDFFKNKYKKAFTLAEILIVLGILGVIASLTIPNLVNSIDNQKYVAKLKTTYSTIDSAYRMVSAEFNGNAFYGLSDSSNVALTSGLASRLFNQMNIDYNCGNTTSNFCFVNKKPKYINGTENSINVASNTNFYKAVLEDSTSIALTCVNSTKVCNVIVDVDGPNKGFNTYGIDLFRFIITPDNMYYATEAALKTNTVSDCSTGNEMLCTAWVIRFDNLDYLDCAASLNISNDTTSCN